MAQSDNPRALDTLGDDRLPARRTDDRLPLPVDPGQRREAEPQKGRKADEVLTRDRGGDATGLAEGEEAERALLKTKHKVMVEDGDDRIVKEMTVEEIIKGGHLSKLITSAGQLPSLTKKHQELLQSIADKELKTTQNVDPAVQVAQFKANHEQATLELIRKYQPASVEEINFYIRAGLMEPDLPEAYQKAMVSLFAILLAHVDMIMANAETTGRIHKWAVDQEAKGQALKTKSVLDTSVDAVAALADDEENGASKLLYEDLKKPEVRAEFVKWLTENIDPVSEKMTPRNVESYWLAYRSGELKKFIEDAAKQVAEPKQTRRRTASDGHGARTGPKESAQEPDLGQRLEERFAGLSPES